MWPSNNSGFSLLTPRGRQLGDRTNASDTALLAGDSGGANAVDEPGTSRAKTLLRVAIRYPCDQVVSRGLRGPIEPG